MLDVDFSLKNKLAIYTLAIVLYTKQRKEYVKLNKPINFGLCAMLLLAAEEVLGDVFDSNYNNVIKDLPEFRDCKPKGKYDDAAWFPFEAFDVRIEILTKCITTVKCQLEPEIIT